MAHNNYNVTVFWKTDHLCTRTEIHPLPVHDRHTMHYPEALDNRLSDLLLQTAFHRRC